MDHRLQFRPTVELAVSTRRSPVGLTNDRAGFPPITVLGQAVSRHLDLNDTRGHALNQRLDGVVQLMQGIGWAGSSRSLAHHRFRRNPAGKAQKNQGPRAASASLPGDSRGHILIIFSVHDTATLSENEL